MRKSKVKSKNKGGKRPAVRDLAAKKSGAVKGGFTSIPVRKHQDQSSPVLG